MRLPGSRRRGSHGHFGERGSGRRRWRAVAVAVSGGLGFKDFSASSGLSVRREEGPRGGGG